MPLADYHRFNPGKKGDSGAFPNRRYKVVILGPYNSGKTTLVHLLDAGSKSVEAEESYGNGETTVAIDFGRFVLDGVMLFLFGTPGQKRFDVVREAAIEGVDGIVFLIDGTRAIDSMVMEVVRIIEQSGIPFVIGVNKVDVNPSARSVVERISESGQIFPISARTGEGVIPMLRCLKEQMGGRGIY